MKIVVCFKNVPDEQSIVANADQTIAFANANLSIGTYDLNAIEAGAQLAEAIEGAELIALTAGDEEAASTKMKKNVLSRGPHRLVVAQNAGFGAADSLATAKALAKAIEGIGGVDLILFGEGSGDAYNQQVGALVGSILGIPTVNAASSIEIDGATAKIARTLEGSVEHLEIALPAAVSVTSDLNKPRIASMKAILAAGKKPMDVEEAEIKNAENVKTVSVLAPEKTPRKLIIFEDANDEDLENFFQALRTVL